MTYKIQHMHDGFYLRYIYFLLGRGLWLYITNKSEYRNKVWLKHNNCLKSQLEGPNE